MKTMVAINERGLRVGEDHQRAKYSDAEVELVHELRGGGLSYGRIAAKMEMPKSTVATICRGLMRCQFPAAFKVITQ